MIGINYQKNVEVGFEQLNILSYFHLASSAGSMLEELKNALENTVQFFPSVNAFRYELQALHTQWMYLIRLFETLLETKISMDVGPSSNQLYESYFIFFKEDKLIDKTKKKGEVEAQTLTVLLKSIVPDLTINQTFRENSDIGVEILAEQIPTLLVAGESIVAGCWVEDNNELEHEHQVARRYDTTSWSLKWFAAKTIWKNPAPDLTSLPEDLQKLACAARKFIH